MAFFVKPFGWGVFLHDMWVPKELLKSKFWYTCKTSWNDDIIVKN